MMRSDSDKSQGSPRGGSDSWHNGGRGSEATTHSATIGLNPLPASPPARYRTQQHHDADHPGASNTEVSLWGRRRGPLGTVQQTPPYPPPQPPHPAHPAHQACLEHQAAPRDDFVFGAFGAALAARIHFPPHRTEPSSNKKTRGRAASQPKHGDNPRVQQRRVTDGTPKLRQISNGSNRSRPIGKPALPPDQPLLDVPMAEGTEPDMLFEAYRDSREFSQRAKDYWLQVGSLHHMFDVFDWWFYRVVDRLERKEYSKIELDPHEKMLQRLIAEESAADKGLPDRDGPGFGLINYFADHMVPKYGFTVEQVETARNDPTRWERRNAREEKWNDASDGPEQQESWRTKHIEAARKKWEAKMRAASNPKPKQKRGNQTNLAKREKGPKGSIITKARFDTRNRIGKKGGNAAASRNFNNRKLARR
ncbi:hypothetical protein FPQ18DRAFT_88318 [Pyronema domesticum]|uniref:Uncharacterized protein n=1 Tax=Pyronema omphalodes (strain CBS 100304) TaxID=1076935 RepID=U4KU80_PYROM|nr:hypothetical protein FPQ18DRAFT_88318 [Pyronema domesticum]CCX04497.1 Protein of unknown function [Pyronema omphalodes CBS 100304]